MIRRGFETTDPFTGTRLVVVKDAEDTGGRGWVTEVHCPESAAPWGSLHVHRTWTETFDILQGTANCRLGTTVHTLRTGETLVMPPGVPHRHPWNVGSGVMVFRHTNEFGASTPEAVHDVIGAFATMNGLARVGRAGRNGLPNNPLQLGATVRRLTKHGAFDAVIPIPIQLALGATLGRLAESLGYRAVDERYL